MSVTSAVGLGSGLDINGIVQALVDAEAAPKLNTIKTRENAVHVRLSALSKLKSSLSEFSKAFNELNQTGSFAKFTPNSSDESILTASAGVNLAQGGYQIEVSQLASSQKLISQGYADSSQAVGKGTLDLTMGADSFSVIIDDSNNSLTGLRDAINEGEDNPGIQAGIIQVDDGVGGTVSKLVLTATQTGTENELTITATEDGGAPGLANFIYDPSGSGTTNLSEQVAATDAIILVDGQTATRSSNSINDVIEGLTLDLKQANPGTKVQLDVSLDEQAIKENVQNFISKYNSLMNVMSQLQNVSPNQSSNGPMVGDALLRSLNSQIRGVLSEPVGGLDEEVNSLAMVGISIDRYGQMSLNDQVFSDALGSNLSSVAVLFSSVEGVATKLDGKIDPYLMTGGILEQQTQSLDKNLKSLTDDKEALDKRLELIEARLTKQFIAMDKIVGQLQSTSAYLTQQLANL